MKASQLHNTQNTSIHTLSFIPLRGAQLHDPEIKSLMLSIIIILTAVPAQVGLSLNTSTHHSHYKSSVNV